MSCDDTTDKQGSKSGKNVLMYLLSWVHGDQKTMIHLFIIYHFSAQFATPPRDKFPVDHQDLEGLDPE